MMTMGREDGPIFFDRMAAYTVIPKRYIPNMAEGELIKHIRLTEEAHKRLVEASERRYGTTSIRWSDVIQQMAEEAIEQEQKQEGNE
ncbi:hypothetical protein [Halomicrococcus gelatinilyticus]|uniref:hypothetical protein n=1 Tax=Halomicrococcus gelatinilyticus TaxID=1702103 RepID=UPI002E108BF0